jgi:hypothetical protein
MRGVSSVKSRPATVMLEDVEVDIAKIKNDSIAARDS